MRVFCSQSLAKLFYQVWPNQVWPAPPLAQTKFGQIFGPLNLGSFWLFAGVGDVEGEGGPGEGGPGEGWGEREAPKGGVPNRGAPEGWRLQG